MAISSPRDSLGPQLSRLNEIRVAWAKIEPPEALKEYHRLMYEYMGLILDSFIAFMGEEDYAEDLFKSLFLQAGDKYKLAEQELERLGLGGK